ncbi:bifunctional 2-polyprenyl-6-hydroxyphenol methylase/3-demethylubiquinol 3-O-methyltransferase UbiG [Magnetospirillum sp. UT-4]|uniref:class I SAM-dependent methyltransferase n=1 Tax=Magnetospirillum sp. UT-4 TaxID=2681467 RepID=UPI001382328C|nr:methyltransferase domain-containing protein [Magnetospirillum sp. UT-4]CAA7621822.1 Methyltransferase type 12 [Magnetospirillum sp. UT-4]
MSSPDLEAMYSHRFDDAHKAQMNGVWRAIIDVTLQRWIGRDAAVLDVGAGYCTFINQVAAGRKVAVDANPHNARHAAADVEFIAASSLRDADLGGRFDVAFMSNFLEHLPDSDSVLAMLADVRAVMKPGGRLIVLQPNFALVGPAYFDFIDHKTILTDRSLVEALELSGFRVVHLKRRFMPYTSVGSRLPFASWLVRLYLHLPFAQFLMGKQTLAVAEVAG